MVVGAKTRSPWKRMKRLTRRLKGPAWDSGFLVVKDQTEGMVKKDPNRRNLLHSGSLFWA